MLTFISELNASPFLRSLSSISLHLPTCHRVLVRQGLFRVELSIFINYFEWPQTSQATRLLTSEFNKYANQDPVESIGIRHLLLVLDILEDGLI